MACERDDELRLSLSLQSSADHNPEPRPSPSPFPLNLFTPPLPLSPRGTEEVMVSCGNSSVSVSVSKEGEIDDRKKLRLSKEQAEVLEESFKEQNSVNPRQKMALAKQLNLRPRQVEVWFQNRRARTKLKQTEVECEYLRRCCENLTEENTRLQEEVNALKLLCTNMSIKICPQCERQTAPPPPRILYL